MKPVDLNLSDAQGLKASLQALMGEKEIPRKTVYTLSWNAQKVDALLSRFEKQRVEMSKHAAEKNERGEPVIIDSGFRQVSQTALDKAVAKMLAEKANALSLDDIEGFQVQGARYHILDLAAFTEEQAACFAAPETLMLRKIRLDDLGGYNPPLGVMLGLMPIIDEGEETIAPVQEKAAAPPDA